MKGKETKDTMELRYNCYNAQWNLIQHHLHEVRTEVYKSTFQSVNKFIENQLIEDETEKYCKIQLQLPVAVILAGVNVLDHQNLLQCLIDFIEKKIKYSLSIVLQSKDCSNVEKAIYTLISSCIYHSKAKDIDFDEKISVGRCSFRQLVNWYKLLCESYKVPQKSFSIIILLKDFECFSSEIIQKIISICCNHLHEISFIFVIGLATSIDNIHRVIPRSICSKLKMEKFSFLGANLQLKKLLQKIFLHQPPAVELGFNVLQLLFNRFEEANISIESFSKSLQFILMEFFYKNPISFLSCYTPEKSNKLFKYLTPAHFAYIRSLPSVYQYCKEELPPNEFRLISQNDQTLLYYISIWVKNIYKARKLFMFVFAF